MKRRNWTAIGALVAVMTLVSGPAAAEQDHSKDTLVHNATGFRFPVVVDGFDRVSVHFFNDAATDISVGYSSLTPGAPLAVTVYVTSAPSVDTTGSNDATAAAEAQSCDQQFAAMNSRVTKVHPDARQLVVGSVKSPSPMFLGTGKQVIYDYDDLFYGQKQMLRSETDLYCYVNGDWLVAFRTTAPVTVDYAPKLAAFMQALAWPPPGAGRRIVAAPPVTKPASGNRVMVRLKAGKAQADLAGLVVTGSDQDITRFETAATIRGVEPHRVTENGKTESIASLLKPHIKLADATDLFRHARDGKYGKLALEVMLLPPGATGEERDLLSRAAIVPAGALETF